MSVRLFGCLLRSNDRHVRVGGEGRSRTCQGMHNLHESCGLGISTPFVDGKRNKRRSSDIVDSQDPTKYHQPGYGRGRVV